MARRRPPPARVRTTRPRPLAQSPVRLLEQPPRLRLIIRAAPQRLLVPLLPRLLQEVAKRLEKHLRGGDIARGNTAFSMLYIVGGLVGRPLTGAAMDLFGEPGLGWTLAGFYAAAALAALLAMRRSG